MIKQAGQQHLWIKEIRQEKGKEYLDEAIRYACKYCVIMYDKASPQKDRENDAQLLCSLCGCIIMSIIFTI